MRTLTALPHLSPCLTPSPSPSPSTSTPLSHPLPFSSRLSLPSATISRIHQGILSSKRRPMAPVHSTAPSSAVISSVGDLFSFILSGPLMPKRVPALPALPARGVQTVYT